MLKNKMKKIKKYAKGMVVGTIALGVGSSVLGGVGGSVASSGQAGMTRVAGFLPTLGGIYGAGLTLDALGKLQKSVPKRKKRR